MCVGLVGKFLWRKKGKRKCEIVARFLLHYTLDLPPIVLASTLHSSNPRGREGGRLSPRALEAGDGGMGAAQRRQCSGMMRDAGCRAAPVEGGWRTSNANIITAAAVGGAADCEHDYFFAQMVCAGRVR